MHVPGLRVLALAAIWVSAGHAAPEGSRLFEFEYRVSLGDVAGHAKVWIPVPQDAAHQDILELNVETDAKHSYVTDPAFDNRFLFIERERGGIAVSMVFVVSRKPRIASDADASVMLSTQDRSRYLDASRMVTTDGIVRDEAMRVAGDEATTRAKARKLYDHIVDTVRYDKSGNGWGRGDAVYACDTRAGNCTDFHSLFIGEARSLGIPSRFSMGFSIPRDKPSSLIRGYHCWAEFYEDGIGWVPLDASEAFKDQTRRDELFGGLDADRVLFTVGRDIKFPGMVGEPINFAIYPYVEVDGKPSDDVEYTFRYRDLDAVETAKRALMSGQEAQDKI
jgi:transglutaminase-like putative cysteine protease